MIIYFSIFALSCGALAVAERVRPDGKGTFLSVVLVGFAIAILSALAGARDEGVGTDTLGYGTWLYSQAESNEGLSDYLAIAMGGTWNMDVLFAVAAYIAVRLTHSIFWYYFFIEALSLIPVYCAISIVSRGNRVWFSFLVYLLVFYALSLNAMRQSIAMGFVILAFALLMTKRKAKAILFIIIAALFHKTAVIAFGLAALFYCLVNPIDSLMKWRKGHLLVIVGFVGLVAIVRLAGTKVLSLLSALVPSFSGYANSEAWGGQDSVAYYVIYAVMLAIILLIVEDSAGAISPEAGCLALIVLLSFVFESMGPISAPVKRMASYTMLFLILLLALAMKQEVPLSSGNLLLCWMLLGVAVVQFWWFFDRSGANEVLPYTSKILGLS